MALNGLQDNDDKTVDATHMQISECMDVHNIAKTETGLNLL